jgi:predicted transcriptional regulator
MKAVYNLSESEKEVMEIVWNYPEGIRQSELLEVCNNKGKIWKRQTLNTFLSRLEEKNMIVRDNRIVKSVYTKDEYYNRQMQKVIDDVYDGKLSCLLTALTKNVTLSEEETRELISIIQNNKR